MALGALAALTSAPSAAWACPVTDPACVVDETKETAEQTVDEVEKTLEGAVEEGVETGNETVREVEETLEDTQEDLGETLNPGDDPEPPAPPTEPKDNDGPRKNDPKDDVKDSEFERDLRNETSDETDQGLAGPGPIDPPSTLPSGEVDTAAARVSSTTLERERGDSPAEIAKRFAFPIVMTLLAGIFLVIQHRIDRRDPKFVLAPVEHEYLSFE